MCIYLAPKVSIITLNNIFNLVSVPRFVHTPVIHLRPSLWFETHAYGAAWRGLFSFGRKNESRTSNAPTTSLIYYDIQTQVGKYNDVKLLFKVKVTNIAIRCLSVTTYVEYIKIVALYMQCVKEKSNRIINTHISNITQPFHHHRCRRHQPMFFFSHPQVHTGECMNSMKHVQSGGHLA
uniref:Uncharacterized protein n=1 Tax=Glossina pallidipes TaxID=7398 RepID=A0A1A9ZE90_GLOPL